MALPLITFTKADHLSPTQTAQLNENTAQILAQNFNPVLLFHPVFVFGSTGKNSLLDTLLKQVYPDLEATEHCFECGEGAVDGVYAWPKPIQIGEATLMLLKLRTPIDKDAAYMELRRKVMIGLVMLSSVCCMCESRGKVLTCIDDFMRDYSPAS